MPRHHADPTKQILLSGSAFLLTLYAHTDLAVLLNRLLARRLRIPSLREQDCYAPLQLRALRAEDEQEIVRY